LAYLCITKDILKIKKSIDTITKKLEFIMDDGDNDNDFDENIIFEHSYINYFCYKKYYLTITILEFKEQYLLYFNRTNSDAQEFSILLGMLLNELNKLNVTNAILPI